MSDTLSEERVERIREYFRLVDERDPSLLDLFTDDVLFYFPKFGSGRGKAALAQFGARIGSYLDHLEHDIDGLIFTVQGDRIAVEGQERGVTKAGVSWPDGVISQGRFCNVFEFEGLLMSRTHIYVDPDFTGSDAVTLALYSRSSDAPSSRESVEQYLAAVSAFHADPTAANLEVVSSSFADDADWNIAGNTDAVPWIGPRAGKKAIAGFFRDLRQYNDPQRFAVRKILADVETVVVLGDLVTRVKATGRLIETEFALDITLRDGLIVRYRLIEDSFAVYASVQPPPET